MLLWQHLVSALFIGNLFVGCNDDSDEDVYAKETQHFMMTEVSNRGSLSKQQTIDQRSKVKGLRGVTAVLETVCSPDDAFISELIQGFWFG